MIHLYIIYRYFTILHNTQNVSLLAILSQKVLQYL